MFRLDIKQTRRKPFYKFDRKRRKQLINKKMEGKEKSTNRTIRRALRVLAYATLVFEIVLGLIVPRLKGVKVDFVPDEWYLILGSVALLVSIEAIKKGVDAYVAKKSTK